MSLFLSLFPVYVFGNLHCFGMCGPLVMLLGKHPFRNYYFAGRLFSFTLTGLLAAEMGFLIQGFIVSSFLCLFLGSMMLFAGIWIFLERPMVSLVGLGAALKPINHSLSMLMLKQAPLPVFAFGFFTVLLPCGQTLLVFSLCALSKSPWEGLINGFLFALFTTPSLFFAMRAGLFLQRYRNLEKKLLGGACIFAGSLQLLRGLADAGVIAHLVLLEKWHLVLY